MTDGSRLLGEIADDASRLAAAAPGSAEKSAGRVESWMQGIRGLDERLTVLQRDLALHLRSEELGSLRAASAWL